MGWVTRAGSLDGGCRVGVWLRLQRAVDYLLRFFQNIGVAVLKSLVCNICFGRFVKLCSVDILR